MCPSLWWVLPEGPLRRGRVPAQGPKRSLREDAPKASGIKAAGRPTPSDGCVDTRAGGNQGLEAWSREGFMEEGVFGYTLVNGKELMGDG